jgi:hypothetical protein
VCAAERKRALLFLLLGETEEALMARREAEQAGEEEARDELGDMYALTETTIVRVWEDWEVEERLDEIIDKYVKRLLMLKGVKSLHAAPPSQPVIRLIAQASSLLWPFRSRAELPGPMATRGAELGKVCLTVRG